jgi:hypothetical protein
VTREEEYFEQVLPDDRAKLWWVGRKVGHQAAFLKYLAHIPSQQWTDSDMEIIDYYRRQFGDAFWKRLARATSQTITDTGEPRLKPLMNNTRKFLFENWKELRFPNPTDLPGLRSWHPRAVWELLKHMRAKGYKGISHRATLEKHSEFRRDLGLKPKLPYIINKLPEEVRRLECGELVQSVWFNFQKLQKKARQKWQAEKRRSGRKTVTRRIQVTSK